MIHAARNFHCENSIKLPSVEDVDTEYNDVNLDIKLINKYFEVEALDDVHVHRRNEYKTRLEQLQKRKEALQDRELIYETYIKELSMKYDRSLRRVEDEKNFIQNKYTEIAILNREIEDIRNENKNLENRILSYQPHLNLLTKIVDQTERFQSIDEIIEKFDLLYASYQDILTTIKASNVELDDAQLELLLTMEKKANKISIMNNRIRALEQNLSEIQQSINKIHTDINNYQQISKEHFAEMGTIKIAIESMFDLVKRYGHHCRRKQFHPDYKHSTMHYNQYLITLLKQVDIFLSDLIYYVDYVNSKEHQIYPSRHSIQSDSIRLEKRRDYSNTSDNDIGKNNEWRGPCELDRQNMLMKAIEKSSPLQFASFKIRAADDRFYTIQIKNADKSTTSPARTSLTPNRSSASLLFHPREKADSALRMSTTKLQRDTRSTRPSLKSIYEQFDSDKVPFS